MVRSVRRRSFAVVTLAAIAWSLAGATIAFADDETRTFPLNVTCEAPQDQLCAPAQTVSITTLGALRVEVVASPGHCSNVIAHVLVDGAERYVSGELAPGASSGFQDLGPVDPGAHQVGVQGEGVLGGCNAGGVANWGGTLNVVVSTQAAVTPTPPTSTTGGPTASPGPGTAGSGAGDSTLLLAIVVVGLLGAGAFGFLFLRRRSSAVVATPPDPIVPPNPVIPTDPHLPTNPMAEADQVDRGE